MKLYLSSGAIQIKTNCLKKLMKALKKSCGRILAVRQFLYMGFESLQPKIIKIAKQINICFAILVRFVQTYSVFKQIAKSICNEYSIWFSSQKLPYGGASVFVYGALAHFHNIIKTRNILKNIPRFWYAVGPVTQYRKVHRTFLPNFFALLKIWTLVFESLQPKTIKIAKQINICFAILVRWKGLEPPTYWFVASHSIQLSYQRVYVLHFLCFNTITQIK